MTPACTAYFAAIQSAAIAYSLLGLALVFIGVCLASWGASRADRDGAIPVGLVVVVIGLFIGVATLGTAIAPAASPWISQRCKP